MRTYSELAGLPAFLDRFRYLSLSGTVGQATFGYERWQNQAFYRSRQWRHIRHHVIARDEGCDLGVPGHDIHSRIIIHHMNPLQVADILSPDALDPEFLITVTHNTHNAIHYGDEGLLPRPFVERRPGDTTPWRTA